MYCRKCGTQNDENNFKCAKCGEVLHPAENVQPVAVQDDALKTLIPYKNSSALISYYLGIFSFIPCVGLPMGIAALILGIKGLKSAKQHPEVKGKAHAWVGIITGGFFALLYLVCLVFFVLVTTHVIK